MTKKTTEVGELTYEAARDELASTVERLEAGGTTLDELVELYRRGEELAARCHELLEGVRQAVSTGSDTEPGGTA